MDRSLRSLYGRKALAIGHQATAGSELSSALCARAVRHEVDGNRFFMSTSVSLGPLTLSSNLLLAPLAGYTTFPFRLCMREVGGFGLATTELIHARSLLEQHNKAKALAQTCPEDSPLAVQLF